MHSVLVEYGVYTNLEGLYALRCYGEELAIGTVNSIKKYFGIQRNYKKISYISLD